MEWLDVLFGFMVGAAVGMVAVAIPSINQADKMRDVIGKLQIDLRYAARSGKNETDS